MTEVYRFRSNKYLLGEPFRELERQTIFFSSPQQLNDPMESFRDKVWRGDRIVWANLFKHYVFCLHQTYLLFKILGDEEKLRADHIPIMGRWDEPTTPQMGELFDDIWNRICDGLGLPNLIDKIATMKRKVRYGELLLYLNVLHSKALDRIQEVWIERGLAPETERPQDTSILRISILADSSFFDLISQIEAQDKNFSNAMFLRSHQVMMGQQLRHKLNLRHSSSEKLDCNRRLLLLDFPNIYLDQLDKLLWPEWYTACFTKSYHNSSVWAHYGDGHEGVCLIFEAVESANGSGLELKRVTGRQVNSRGDYKEHWRFTPMYFHDIGYSDRPVIIDFFRNMGVLPLPALMKLWYTDEAGNISDCAAHFSSDIKEEPWREKHWDDFKRVNTTKSKDWEYEQECRLILYGLLDLSLENRRRALTYQFESLKGVIFGIRTSDEVKMGIIEVIQRKCLENDRTDFKFFQAYYSPEHEDIRKYDIWVS